MKHQNTRKASRMPAADLVEAHRTYHEETLFEAVVVAGVVVALADGQVDTAERLELVRFVEQCEMLPTFTPSDTSDAFDSRVRQFEMVGSVYHAAFKTLRKVDNRPEISEVVEAAESVASADGHVQPPEERQVIQFIRSTIAPL
jgi:tellurite resistance protein TerB